MTPCPDCNHQLCCEDCNCNCDSARAEFALAAERRAHEATRAELAESLKTLSSSFALQCFNRNLVLAAEEKAHEATRKELANAVEQYRELRALNERNFTRATEHAEMHRQCQRDFDTLKVHHEATRAEFFAAAQLLRAERAKVARLRAALEEVQAWRRSAVGLVPQPKSDPETLGFRIDAALADTAPDIDEPKGSGTLKAVATGHRRPDAEDYDTAPEEPAVHQPQPLKRRKL